MLYFVPTPIGNLGDISLRSLELLQDCELILCEDTRVCKHLLHLLSQKYQITCKARKILSLHSHNENAVLENLPKLLQDLHIDLDKNNVLYMSDAGMPCVSDPGVKLVQWAFENKIAYEVLPGANAALTALVASGFCDKNFTFLGFLPSKKKQLLQELNKALQSEFISIVYEAPTRVIALVEAIAKLDEGVEIFAVKELSKKFEKKFKNTAIALLKELEKENLNGEWTLVICPKKSETKELRLSEKDIKALDIAPKARVKLLALLHKESAKNLYAKTILQENTQ